MKLNKLILLNVAILALAISGAAQSRTNRIQRPCSGSASPAYVEITKAGDVNIVPCSGKTLKQNGTSINIAQPYELLAAVTDEVTTISAANGALTFYVPRDFTASQMWASVSTASSSGLVTVNIKKNGVSVFSTQITIDATENTSLTAATPAVLSTTSFVQGDKITVDIVGAGTGTVGLKIYILGTR